MLLTPGGCDQMLRLLQVPAPAPLSDHPIVVQDPEGAVAGPTSSLRLWIFARARIGTGQN
jgi:hypothetical protein